MSDEETVIPETEKKEEKETLEKTGTQTDEGAEGTQPEGGDVEKKEENHYEKQLKELKADNEKKDDIIDKKNRALESEKKRRKALESEAEKHEEKGDEEKPSETVSRLERIERSLLRKEIHTLTDSPEESELVEHYFYNRIQRTGDDAKDLELALAGANSHLVAQAKEDARIKLDQENDIIQSTSSGNIRGSKTQRLKDPLQKDTENWLKDSGIDPKYASPKR